MKKGLLFLMLSALTIGAWADDVVAVVDNIGSYSGTASYVYNKADSKTYARNTSGSYEVYGIYEKVAATQIDYIATDASHNTYINTGYVHKTNTRVVADVMFTAENGNWNAVFGSRKGGGGGATNGLAYFWRANGNNKGMYKRNTTEYFGNDQGSATAAEVNQRYTIDANGNTVTVTKQGESSAYSTITCSGDLSAGINPLFIFDLSTGDGSPDNSRSLMRLYSLKIYEGDVLVHDYVPVATSIGKGGLRDNQTGDILFSAKSDVDFVKSSDVTVAAYNGKMSVNLGDRKVYRYNGTSYVEVGSLTLGSSISGTDYKNMKNWRCPDGHWASVFGSGDKITYNAEAGTNSFNPYEGNGGWEPLHCTIPVEANAYYNVSFKYSTSGWNTWNTNHSETPDPISLPFKIIDRESYSQNLGFYTDAGLIAYAKLTNQAVTNQDISVNFTSTTNVARFIIQFGVVDDGSHNPAYTFGFDNWDVKKYSYPVAYPDMNLLIQTIAVVKERGVNTSAAEAVVQAYDRTQTTVSNALYNLRTSTKMYFLDKHDNVFSGNTPAAGDYYLYNVGTQAFFCGGSDWGTHAAIGFPGIKVTLETGETEGTFYINTHLSNGEGKNYLNDTGYCDTNTKSEWKFVSTGDKKSYFIKRNSDDSKMLGWNSTTTEGYSSGHSGPYFNNVSTYQGSTTNSDNKWMLVTETERNDLMDGATVENPVDVSYLIQSPNFNQREDISKWMIYWGEGTTGGQTHRGDREPYYIYDAYNSKAKTDLHQTVEGLRPGLYRVTTTAMYRKPDFATGDNDIKARLYAYEGDPVEEYSAEADANTVLLPNITTGFNKAPGFDTKSAFGSHKNVCKAMEMGAFEPTSINVAVGSDGKLTFGVMKEDNSGGDCTYADNWRLTYLGGYCELSEDDESTVNETAYVAKLSRKLKTNKWNTFCSPFAMSKSDIATDVDVKELLSAEQNGENYTMTFSNAESIEAGKPYMVRVNSGSDETIDIAVEKQNVEGIAINTTSNPSVTEDGVTFTGVYTSGSAPEGSFIISNNNFYLVDSDVTLKAFRGYITVPAGVKALNFTFEDEATAINEELRMKSEEFTPVFNLAGQRISKMQKGINIVNGKKILK